MVEVTTKVQQPQQAQSHDDRMRERTKFLNSLRQRPGVRVVPKDDVMRKLMKHPKAGKFRAEGGLEWPDDNFTRKRLRDGDVTLEEKSEEKQGAAWPVAVAASASSTVGIAAVPKVGIILAVDAAALGNPLSHLLFRFF